MAWLPRLHVRAFVLLTSVFAVPLIASAQAPSISRVSPGAVQPGQTTTVTLTGGNLAGITKVWTSFPSKAVLATNVKNNGKNAGSAVYNVTVPKGTPVGIHGIRVVTNNGVSALRLIVVDDLKTVASNGKNTSAATAQPIKTPIAIEGAIPNLGRHFYLFDGKSGQRLSIEVLAGRIGSPLDPNVVLHLFEDGVPQELAYSEDAPGLHGDSQFSHVLPKDGKYLVEVRDITFKGSANHRYRLRLGDFPCVTAPYPMGAKRGSQTMLSFGGSDITGLVPTKVAVPKDPKLQWLTVGAKRKGGQCSGFATLAVTDSDIALEKEPNNNLKQATRVTLGANINGRFEKPGDVDRFVFTAKKGQRFTFDAVTRSQGSPTDLVMELQNPNGSRLSQSDDSGTMADGAITYTFPADGDYQLMVKDLHQRGGSQFVYRVVVSPASAGFGISASADHLNVPAGGTAAITVTPIRKGYNGTISLSVEGLPAGMTASPAAIGPSRGDAVITISGTPKVKRGELIPIRIIGTATIGKSTVKATADVAAAIKSISGGYPYPTKTLNESLVAAAAPAAPFALTTSTNTLNIPRGKNAKVTIKLTRTKPITEQVNLVLPKPPKKNPKRLGLPPGLSVAVKPIAKGKNEVTIVVTASKKAPKGSYTVTILAQHKKGKATITQRVPSVVVNVQ